MVQLNVKFGQGWSRLKRGGAALAAAAPARAGLVERVGALRRGVSNLVFPPTCLCCDSELDLCESPQSEVLICDACLEQMDLFSGPTCVRCGARVPFTESLEQPGSKRARSKGGCFRCRGRKMRFDETIALGLYGDQLRELLLRMKQAEGDGLSLAMGRLLWRERRERLHALAADVVVPIPLHWRRRLAHRTNSAAVMAEVLSAQLGVPLGERLLRRLRYTVRQFDLSPPKRWENVRKAFTVRAGYHLRDAHVLLVDDILTTGATRSEAARALRSAGAARVSVVVVARALG